MGATYRWMAAEGEHYELWAGERRLASIKPPEDPDFTYTDRIIETEPGVFRWERTFVYTGSANKVVSGLTMELAMPYKPEYWMIPGVSYNGNGWGCGKEPKGAAHNGQYWSFASHRTTIAGATYSEGPADSAALFAVSGRLNDRPADIGCACSIVIGEDETVHRLIWPEEEGPEVYAYRDGYAEPYRQMLHVRPGDQLEAAAYIVLQPVELARHGWHKLLRVAWQHGCHPVRAWHEPERIWELGITFARDYLWVEDGIFRGFVWGLHRDDGEWRQKRDWPYEIGWVGQNASLANSLLADYVRGGSRISLEKGIAALDCWAEHAPQSNGLFRCHFQHIVGYPLDTAKSGDEVQDACNLSTAALQYFEAQRLAAQCGLKRPCYTEIALAICDFALRAQSPSGRFGKSWFNDGTAADPEGTIGCYLVPALLEAYRTTKEQRYLGGALRGYHYYIAEFIANGYSTAGALDTYCIDKESAIPLLRGGLELYELTQKPAYLDYAVRASRYIASWQMHHTVPFPEDSALGRLGYDTFGGTTVSAQHHHIDHFAVAIVPEWLRLTQWTGDYTWRQRAQAAWANATAVISDGSLRMDGPVRPPGGQDEGFCHTRWHTRWGNYYGVSQWLVAWPTAFRLEALRHSRQWSDFCE
ncbi:hypothetical protein [Paenibacillus piri]|uniref:Uncharacterized protein n=1 Tax=Paenibacillus piri TaxID=2547395 RepID=A0A4R5KUT1_9BACL|nr:hypothetical protein [Paenibacillus piri]TDF99689.1 hypothetical protein E1757_07630 [Paenibacillus piri]